MAYKKTHKGKKAPPGMHFMPNGKLMKDSAHKKGTAKKTRKVTGKRKKLDANKDGKITKADFRILRGKRSGKKKR
tara:strand:- start:717 stop:941 length:225 start_codon:yes stop_codon:yes gene_type:complete